MTEVSSSTSPTIAEVAEGSAKMNLLGLPEAKLVAFFESIGEKKFRAVQVMKWIHQLGADNFDDMTKVFESNKFCFLQPIPFTKCVA